MRDDKTAIRIEADISDFESAMAEMEDASRQFASAFTHSMRTAIASGRDFDDVLRSIAARLAGKALDRALAPLQNMLGHALANALPSRPAAAGSDASLIGAQPVHAAAPSAPVSVTIQSANPDAFRKSEPQIAAMLARAVRRGRRGL